MAVLEPDYFESYNVQKKIAGIILYLEIHRLAQLCSKHYGLQIWLVKQVFDWKISNLNHPQILYLISIDLLDLVQLVKEAPQKVRHAHVLGTLPHLVLFC